MSFSWLSIMGMYEHDPTIFDDFNVPDGMDKETVVNNILLNCAELELIYSNFDIMKLAIKTWSDSNQIGWNKIYQTMIVEYNPIWNVDADVKDTEKISGNRGIKRTGSDNETVNLTDTETVNLTDTKAVQGFNSSSWANAEKIDHTGTDTINHTGTDTIKHTGTDNIAHTENIDEDNDSVREYTQRRTGNIGVTTTQQMIEQEREVALFNMVEHITNSFKNRFCLMIY